VAKILYVPKKILNNCVIIRSVFFSYFSATSPKNKPMNAAPHKFDEVMFPTALVGRPPVLSIKLKIVPYIPCVNPSINVKSATKTGADMQYFPPISIS
jgi:hypothetical protein